MRTRKIANGLGWFSIALGLTEIIGAKPLSKALGLSPTLIRVFGVREILAGVGILGRSKKGPGVWARIGGDALDVLALGNAMRSSSTRANAAIATALVAPVVALDVVCGKELGLHA
jgi:hypothetical protein